MKHVKDLLVPTTIKEAQSAEAGGKETADTFTIKLDGELMKEGGDKETAGDSNRATTESTEQSNP